VDRPKFYDDGDILLRPDTDESGNSIRYGNFVYVLMLRDYAGSTLTRNLVAVAALGLQCDASIRGRIPTLLTIRFRCPRLVVYVPIDRKEDSRCARFA